MKISSHKISLAIEADENAEEAGHDFVSLRIAARDRSEAIFYVQTAIEALVGFQQAGDKLSAVGDDLDAPSVPQKIKNAEEVFKDQIWQKLDRARSSYGNGTFDNGTSVAFDYEKLRDLIGDLLE